MLGNERHNEINDPEFVDRAWSEMSGMLDKEMPVVPVAPAPSNRYGLLLLVLLIGFVAGVGTMFLVQKESDEPGQPNQPQHQQVATDEPIASTTMLTPAQQQLTSTAEASELNTSTISAGAIEKQIQNQLLGANRSTIKTSKLPTIDITKLYTNSSSVIVNTSTPISEKNIVSQAIPVVEDKMAFGTDESIFESNDQKVALLQPRSTFAALTPLTTNQPDLLDWNSNDPDLELLALAQDPKLNFGFYFGSQTRDFKGMHGMTSGIYASYQLDAKFAFRTGLGYSLIKGFQAKTIGVAEPLTPEFFDPIETNIDDYSTVASLESNQDLPFQSLHYLDVPFGLDYRMTENFGILMGLKLSYLLHANTDGYLSDNLTNEELALLDKALYRSLRKTDVATVLGFGIYPSSKMGVELKYNHGLVDYTIDENWHVRQLNTNKTFELSLNYFFR